MESSLVSPKFLLLSLVLLLVASVLQLQARELGGSQDRLHDGGLPSVLVLPIGDDDDGAAVVPPKVSNALPGGVSRQGGRAPPAPEPGKRRQPGQSPDVVVSSPGVTTGNQKQLAPQAPAGNPPPHYRRLGPAADLLRVFRDALARVLMWLLPEQT